MFRISKLTDYALLIMSELARAQKILSAAELAQLLHLSTPTVSKILKILSEKKLVYSVRGSIGGYHLAKGADVITVADIITAMEGKQGITECAQKTNLCALDSKCTMRANWRKINAMVQTLLGSFTLLDMLKPITQQEVSK